MGTVQFGWSEGPEQKMFQLTMRFGWLQGKILKLIGLKEMYRR